MNFIKQQTLLQSNIGLFLLTNLYISLAKKNELDD